MAIARVSGSVYAQHRICLYARMTNDMHAYGRRKIMMQIKAMYSLIHHRSIWGMERRGKWILLLVVRWMKMNQYI